LEKKSIAHKQTVVSKSRKCRPECVSILLHILSLLRKNGTYYPRVVLHVLNTKYKIYLAVPRQAVSWLISLPRRRKFKPLGVQKEIATNILGHIPVRYIQCDFHNKTSFLMKKVLPLINICTSTFRRERRKERSSCPEEDTPIPLYLDQQVSTLQE